MIGARSPAGPGQAALEISSLQKSRIFGVLVDVTLHERALGDQLEAFTAHLVERALHQFRPDALAAEFGRNLGVNDGDDVTRNPVIGRGEVAITVSS